MEDIVAPPSSAEQKFWATLQARAALKGIQLVESRTERGVVEYIASWNALTRVFSNLPEIDAWLGGIVDR